jgi:hypothetical protein
MKVLKNNDCLYLYFIKVLIAMFLYSDCYVFLSFLSDALILVFVLFLVNFAFRLPFSFCKYYKLL